MTLGEVIAMLEAEPDKDRAVPVGLTYPHSYRGYYDQLAFEPCRNVSVGGMLNDARGALGKVFQGYKGGNYVMTEHTDCWLAKYGACGEELGPLVLGLILGRSPEDLLFAMVERHG